MVILMVLERDFPPDLRVENEIKSLQDNNHKVILACFSKDKKSVVYDWNGCAVYKKHISNIVYKSSVGALKLPIYFNFWKKHINSILKKEQVDAIHIHDLPLAKIGYIVKNKYNIKFTLDLHENWPAYLSISNHTNTTLGKLLSSNKQWEKYEKTYCNKADNVIVVVDEAKDRLKEIGIDKEKITIVSNYPELSDFDDLPEPSINDIKKSEKIILFYAGGINYHRGLQFVIKALPEALKKYRNIEIRIFGQGNYKQELSILVKKLNLEKNVVFYGQVPYSTVLKELIQSHITLIPHTKNEHTDSTVPHKLFQYIYAGKPILASNCLPIERIIKEINAGAIYTWDNSNETTEKLIWIIDNYNTFITDKLKNTITQHYSWEKEVLKLVTMYK